MKRNVVLEHGGKVHLSIAFKDKKTTKWATAETCCIDY